ncbi:MAG: ABC transporter substrate-binding protein [Chloroflexi bacterium]|nr:ABC transporter substrate-binding protein [Chloroflexota bacterium]
MKKRIGVLVALVFVVLVVVGCATAPSVPAAQPIIIGVPTALGTIEGTDSLNSVKMAVDEINAKGGVNVGGTKRPLQVESIDTREAEPGIPVNDALSAVEKLILEKKLNAIVVGAFRSEVLPASMDLVGKYKIPYLTTIGMAPVLQQKVTEDYNKYKYFFRVGFNSTYLVQYMTQTMGFLNKEFGFTKAYIVDQDVAWAKGTGGGVEAWFKGNGWTVLGHDSYPVGASDFASSLTKAKDGKADVLVPIFDMPQAGILLKQARAMQLPSLLTGFISPVAPASAWKTFEGEVDGMVNFVFEVGPLAVKAVPASVTYNENYGKKFGEEARNKLSGHGPGPAYDSVYILAAAIERAGSVDGDALVTALEATDMNGVIGKIKFSKDHQVVYGMDPKEAAIGAAFQWKNGVRVPVFPAVAAESKIELPKFK